MANRHQSNTTAGQIHSRLMMFISRFHSSYDAFNSQMFSAASTDKSYASWSNRATAAQRECLKVNATGKNVTVLTFSSSGLETSTIWRKHVCETFDVIIEIAGVKHDSQTKVALLCTSSRLQNSFASTNYNESTEWKTNLNSSLEAKPKRDLFITIFFAAAAAAGQTAWNK